MNLTRATEPYNINRLMECESSCVELNLWQIN